MKVRSGQAWTQRARASRNESSGLSTQVSVIGRAAWTADPAFWGGTLASALVNLGVGLPDDRHQSLQVDDDVAVGGAQDASRILLLQDVGKPREERPDVDIAAPVESR